MVVLLDLGAHLAPSRRASRRACPARSPAAEPGSSRPWCRCGGRGCRPRKSVSQLVGSSIESSLKPVLYGSALKLTSSNTKNSASGPKKIVSPTPVDFTIGLGLLGDAARIAVVGLAGGRLEHVADDRQRGLGEERIDAGGRRIRHQVHVGLVDRLPAGDRGAVEHRAFGEGLLVDHADVEGDVLPLAARVGEAEVDVFDVVVLDRLQDIFSGLHGSRFPLLRI